MYVAAALYACVAETISLITEILLQWILSFRRAFPRWMVASDSLAVEWWFLKTECLRMLKRTYKQAETDLQASGDLPRKLQQRKELGDASFFEPFCFFSKQNRGGFQTRWFRSESLQERTQGFGLDFFYTKFWLQAWISVEFGRSCYLICVECGGQSLSTSPQMYWMNRVMNVNSPKQIGFLIHVWNRYCLL